VFSVKNHRRRILFFHAPLPNPKKEKPWAILKYLKTVFVFYRMLKKTWIGPNIKIHMPDVEMVWPFDIEGARYFDTIACLTRGGSTERPGVAWTP